MLPMAVEWLRAAVSGSATRQWRGYFPRLVSQSASNRRARELYGVLAGSSEWIRQAVEPHVGDARVYEVIEVRVRATHTAPARLRSGSRFRAWWERSGAGGATARRAAADRRRPGERARPAIALKPADVDLS